MARKPKPRVREEGGRVNVGLFPEVHRVIAHQAIEENRPIRDQVHVILCHALGREDLLALTEVPEAVAS